MYPKPIDCQCGHEISWAATIEDFSLGKKPYFAAVCGKCGKQGSVGRTAVEAAIRWNLERTGDMS